MVDSKTFLELKAKYTTELNTLRQQKDALEAQLAQTVTAIDQYIGVLHAFSLIEDKPQAKPETGEAAVKQSGLRAVDDNGPASATEELTKAAE